MSKSEALRLADVSRLSRHHEWHLQVDVELRRLHAERAAADGVINDLVAKVRELQEANEAFGKRQEWWNEKMLTLEAQRDALKQTLHDELAGNLRLRDLGGARPDEPMLTFLERIIAERDALLEALKEIVDAADGAGWEQLDPSFKKARAAIAKAEGGQ